MNVLNTGNYYYITGGSDSYMFGLSDILENNGHQVIPFAPQDERNEPTEWSSYFPQAVDVKNTGLKGVPNYLYNRDAKTKLRQLLETVDIDVAHLHIYYGRLTGAIFKPLQEKGVPIVQSLHEYKLACPVYTMTSGNKICEACQGHKFWKAIPRKCKNGSLSRTTASVAESYVTRWLGAIDKIDHFIAVSDFMRDKMLQYNIGQGKISTVHNFVDTTNYKPSEREGNYFFYFGRLERLKGIFTLLEASARIPDTPLIIAGTGAAEAELKAMIHERGLHHIKLVGFQSGEDLENLIKGSICTLMPSEWYENCPMSVLESLAYARPVIGSRIGGIPELIKNEKDGFLYEVGNADELFEKLKWMQNNRLKAVQMGIKGREKVEQRFGKEEHYKKIMDVYNKVLK